MDRFERSFRLVAQSFRVLMQDTGLMLLVAALYRYATDGEVVDGFDKSILATRSSRSAASVQVRSF